jgi:hypothetical protein
VSSRAGFTDRCQTSYCDKERTTHEKQDQIACGRNDHRAGYGCGKCCHSAGDEAGGRRPRPSRFNSSPFHASSLTRPPPAFRRVRLGRQRRRAVNTPASNNGSNISRFRNSSRSLPLNDSTYPFSHGLPGSIYSVFTPPTVSRPARGRDRNIRPRTSTDD